MKTNCNEFKALQSAGLKYCIQLYISYFFAQLALFLNTTDDTASHVSSQIVTSWNPET